MKTTQLWHILEDGKFHHLVQTTETTDVTDTISYYVDGKLIKKIMQPTSDRKPYIDKMINEINNIGSFIPIALTQEEITYVYNQAKI